MKDGEGLFAAALAALVIVALLAVGAGFLFFGTRRAAVTPVVVVPAAGGAGTPEGAGGGDGTPLTAPGANGTRAGGGDTVPEVDEHTPRLAGFVLTRGGEPIAGARVSCSLVDGVGKHFLARGRTDDEGRFEVLLPALAGLSPIEVGLARLDAVAVAQGFQSLGKSLALEGRELSALELELRLRPGGTITGTVLRGGTLGARSPAAGATVELLAPPVRPEERARVIASTVADGKGDFGLGFVSGGRVLVRARDPGYGVALEELALEPGASTDLGELVLGGDGGFAGSVRDLDGRGVPGVEVVCFPESERDTSPGSALQQRLGELEDETGLLFARARTDGEGGFHVDGLKEGRYVFRLPGDPAGEASRSFPTGSRGVELVFAARRIAVRVQDSERRPYAGVEVLRTADDPGSGRRVARARTDSRGRAWLPAPDAGGATVSALLPGRPPLEQRVEAGEPDEVVFTVAAEATGGSLRVVARDEGGRDLSAITVSLFTGVGGVPIARLRGMQPDAVGRIEGVPAGRYTLSARVVVDAEPGFFHEAREAVEVPAGGEASVQLVFSRGGRIRLSLELPEGHPGVDPDGDLDAHERRVQHGAHVLLAPRGGSARFLVPDEGGLRVESLLLPGEEATTENLLEPGVYTVSVRAPGFAAAEQEVVVTAGRVTEARVELEPR